MIQMKSRLKGLLKEVQGYLRYTSEQADKEYEIRMMRKDIMKEFFTMKKIGREPSANIESPVFLR